MTDAPATRAALGDEAAHPDPASPYATKRQRRAAWAEWEARGGTLDDLPPGLVSASLDACSTKDGRFERWRR